VITDVAWTVTLMLALEAAAVPVRTLLVEAALLGRFTVARPRIARLLVPIVARSLARLVKVVGSLLVLSGHHRPPVRPGADEFRQRLSCRLMVQGGKHHAP
jgi:hypothetical protein